MIVDNVMDEQASALSTVGGLRIHAYEEDKIVPPAAMIGLPTNIKFDETYGRGMDSWIQEITILVSRVGGGRVRRDAIAPYASGSGAMSIKKVLERHKYASCDIVHVAGAAFDVVSIAGVQYLAVIFTVNVSGQGG